MTSSAEPEAQPAATAPGGKRRHYLEWDEYFMATALLSAKRSKDPVTQVGACIVDTEKRIVAIGYNGFPRNCSDDEFPWSKLSKAERLSERNSLEDKGMYVVHAEANAILNKNSSSLKDTTLYVTLFPCNECTKLIIQCGITRIFYISDKKCHKSKYQASRRMLDAAKIDYTQFVTKTKAININFHGTDSDSNSDSDPASD